MRGKGSGSNNYEFEASKSVTAVFEKGGKTKYGDGKDYYKLRIIDRDTNRLYSIRIYQKSYTPEKGKLAGVPCLPCYVTSMIYRGRNGGIR